MDIENTLGKAIGYKFETQAEIRKTYYNLFDKSLDVLAYVMKPLVLPLGKVIDKLLESAGDNFPFDN